MSNSEKSKRKDIAELIRLMTSHPDQLEPNICKFVQQSLVGREGMDVNKYIRSNLSKLQVPFDETFTHDEIVLLISFYKEIKQLIFFYKSDAMSKLLRKKRMLFDPIYEVYHQGYIEMQNMKKGANHDSDL